MCVAYFVGCVFKALSRFPNSCLILTQFTMFILKLFPLNVTAFRNSKSLKLFSMFFFHQIFIFLKEKENFFDFFLFNFENFNNFFYLFYYFLFLPFLCCFTFSAMSSIFTSFEFQGISTKLLPFILSENNAFFWKIGLDVYYVYYFSKIFTFGYSFMNEQ